MSIPERFLRIAKYKLSEIKDRIERWDEESQQEAESETRRTQGRADARRELDDALAGPSTSDRPAPRAPDITPSDRAARPPASSPPRRTPEEIARGSWTGGSTVVNAPAANPPQTLTTPDPLLPHFHLLGVEPGADFQTVQAAYNKLAARCDPARFPAGSEDERTAQRLRERLDASYKALRDALDPTARRFDLLEFDPKPPTAPDVGEPSNPERK